MPDILIKNGLIVDGTGSAGFKADILIKEDCIHGIGPDLEAEGCKIIDGSNKIISPGFIDMHSHGDLTILSVNKAEAAVMQGVTTIVTGMCGIGLAPSNENVKTYYSNFVTKMLGSKEITQFDTLQDYFSAIENKGVSVNLVFFIPQGNVRASVMGMDDRKATDDETEEMKNIVRKGMEAGAFGITTGLIYPPGSVTPTDEIIELCKIVSNYNGMYISHMRNEGTGIIKQGMKELIEIAEKADLQAHISHWKATSSFAWKLVPDMINMVKNARSKGLNIHADMYPYDESSTSLAGVLLRPWTYENFKENLTNQDTRKKIVDDILNLIFSSFPSQFPTILKKIPKSIILNLLFAIVKRKIRIISVMHNHEIEGKFLGEALKSLYPDRKIIDALLDFIRDEEGSIMVSFKMMNDKKSIFPLIKQEFVCIGSDGFLVPKGNTHPRSYGTFAKILSRLVKENNLFSLEEGIRKMTSLPASILGIEDRGTIKQGKKADIVVFDYEKIKDTATYKNGCRHPEGIDYVIVNGRITVDKGRHKGILEGRILRKT